MYSAEDVARYVIDYSWSKHVPVSNLRLQKILYFVQAEFLVEKDRPCFDDVICAWTFGPVVPSVYYEYKVFGSASIPADGIDRKDYCFNSSDRELINGIVDECNNYSTAQLVEITHHQRPWITAVDNPVDSVIYPKNIREYFKED